MGIVVTSTVLTIEPIGFQQNMQIERGYQNAIPDFFFKFRKLENNNRQNLLFSKNSQDFFNEFLNTGICVKERSLMYLYVYKIRVSIFENG